MLIAGIFLIGQTMQQASAQMSHNHKQTIAHSDQPNVVLETDPDEMNAPSLRPSRLISIPYGFDTPLPVINSGGEVVASGHGGCTDGQQVTIAVTVTQSSAVATGEKVQDCTGEEQNWSTIATVDTVDSLAAGTAEACGLATTRDNGSVTDTFDWCVDVDLVEADISTYLPIIMKP